MTASSQRPVTSHDRIAVHLRIMGLDHSFKLLFIVPGILLTMTMAGSRLSPRLLIHVLAGLVAATLIASSNYVNHEILDAPFDRLHPTKKNRPAANDLVHSGWGYAQWIGMMIAGLALASLLGRGFLFSAAALWCMHGIHQSTALCGYSMDRNYVSEINSIIYLRRKKDL